MELIEEYLDISVIIAEVFVMQKRYTDALTTLYYVRRLRDEIFLKISDFIVFPKVNDKGIIKYLSYNGI